MTTKLTYDTILENKKAVIFDLDGSLVDSMWIWEDIDIEYLGRFQIPLPEGLRQQIEGMSFSETAKYFKETFQIPDSIEQMKADWNQMAFDKYEKEVELKPGVEDFLKECQKRGIKLGIATSNSRELMNTIAKAHDLDQYFSYILTGSEVERGKPAPDIYLAVAGKLNVDPKDCLVFEDIIQGIMAGKAAGMTVCAVEDAYSMEFKKEKEDMADYYIEDYTLFQE